MKRAAWFSDVLPITQSVTAPRTTRTNRPVLAACFLLSSFLGTADVQAQAFSRIAPDDGSTTPVSCGVAYDPHCVSIGWTSFPLADHYEYCISNTFFWSGDAGVCEGHWVNVGTATYATIEGLALGTQWFWEVRLWSPIIGWVYANSASNDRTWFRAGSFWTRPRCTTFSIDPPSVTPTAAAGSRQVTVETTAPANCLDGNWNATGNGTWLTVAPGSGVGAAVVTVSWTSNPGPGARSGTATIAGRPFGVTQSAPPACTAFSITPRFEDARVFAGSRWVEIQGAAPDSCVGGNWNATGCGTWLSVLPTSGTGSGGVTVSWTANPGPGARSCTAIVAVSAFDVVQAAPPLPFTDEPALPGNSVIKASHIEELRSRVNTLRTHFGLSQFAFSDALHVGTTPVRAAHIAQLRSALSAAYTAAGRTPPLAYTDPSLSPGMRVRAVHVNELREVVKFLESWW
jgi:hypothetical protein